MIRRRDLIAMLGGATGAWCPHALMAQAARHPALIGFLSPFREQDERANNLVPFLAGMRELGYVEGDTFKMADRYAGLDNARLPALAQELVRLGCDVILAQDPVAALVLKRATSTVPIVFLALTDPIAMGLIASYARPGGNITGMLVAAPGMSGKQLEIALEIIPGATRIGVLVNPENPAHLPQQQEIETAAASRGVAIVKAEVHNADALGFAFRSLKDAGVGAVIVTRDTQFLANPSHVAELAAAARLPSVYAFRFQVEAGGLISYGVSIPGTSHRVAYFVDRILRGARPADLPVEFPTTLDMAINLKTAKAFGLTIPPSLLIRADEVIE